MKLGIVTGVPAVLGLTLFACAADDTSSSTTGTSGGAGGAMASSAGATSVATSGGNLGNGGLTNGGSNATSGGATARGGSASIGGSSTLGGQPSSGGLSTSAGGATSNTGGRAVTAGGSGGSALQGGAGANQGGTNVGGTNVGGTNVGGASVGGRATSGGASTTGGNKATGGGQTGGANVGGSAGGASLPRFSFFVASQVAMTRLSGSSNGFGGDLRYGLADGLSGADKICTEIAESAMPGAGAKVWRAFLSATLGPDGSPVNAIDRVGPGPWYDRLGRVVALNKTALANTRPQGADPAIINDLPNETGTPNHVASGTAVDNHDTLTGSNAQGQLGTTTRANTCNDWTSSVGATGRPQIGHSWPRSATSAMNWMSDHTAPGCAAGVNTGSQNGSGTCVGCSGGYGGIYCFALTP